MPLEPLKPNATGFINSFANNGINNDVKIPARRLSFITASDQAKFERLFRSRVPKGSNTISGNDCRAILMKSGLQPSQLARIWTLCDTSKAGELLYPEFALAMHLVNDVLQGDSIPYELDSKTKNEVSSFIDAINLSIASQSYTDLSQSRTPFDQFMAPGSTSLQPQSTGLMPQTSFGLPLQSQMTGGGTMIPQNTGFMPQTSFGMPVQTTGGPQLSHQLTGGRLNNQTTGFMPQTSFNAPLQGQATGNGMLQPQTTGSLVPAMMNQNTGNFTSLQPQTTGSFVTPLPQQGLNDVGQLSQPTGGASGAPIPQPAGNLLQPQLTGSLGSSMAPQAGNIIPQQMTAPASSNAVPQPFGNVMAQQGQMTGGFATSLPSQSIGNIVALQSQQTGYLPPSDFNPTMPLAAQKTGFGNNEIYAQSNFGINFTAQNEDSISPEEKSLFYKIFETFDTQKRGVLDSASAVEVFRKSGLNRNDLEHIWNLCDVNNSGQLNKQEFALGMHLVYRKLNGFQLPTRLPLSLIPSSTKIIDNVKNQLKNVRSTDDKHKNSKMDALSYKNNDEEEALPSFRNRRKVFNNTVTTGRSSNSSVDKNKKKIESLRKAIKEKRDRLNAEMNRRQTTSADDQLKRIEILKAEIKDLPQLSVVENDAVPADLKNRFDRIISKLPYLFSQISNVDDEIMHAKVELYKLKNSSSLSGSGPNGELTEDDRKKAKSKALFKARMDALTGKQSESTDSFEQEEKRYNIEIAKIKDESTKNQHIIDDIRRSISEISASLQSNMNGGIINKDPSDFAKWEFGVGLENEVRSFINSLNSAKLPSSGSAEITPSYSSSMTNQSDPAHTYAPNKSLDDKSSYQKAETVTNPLSNTSVNHAYDNKNNTAEDEEDEEEKRLRKQLEDLKLKKKAEKERRLAELRRQIEEAEEESDEEQERDPRAKNFEVGAPRQVVATNLATESTQSATDNSSEPAPSTSVVDINSNKPLTSTATGRRNPFFKQEVPSTSSFDQKAAETQRRLQRGLDDDEDDGWSDDEPKEAPGPSSSSTVGESQNITQVNTAMAPDDSQLSAADSALPAPAVPLAPPLPALATPSSSHGTEYSAPPVPIAPPLPQVNASVTVPPVPVAPPLPVVHSGSEFAIPPPPPLPVEQTLDNALDRGRALGPNEAQADGEDSDDVLSIPESVASDGGHKDSAPSGIPPPPPLP